MTPAQLELRRKLITATDAAAICQVAPWRNVHDVYADKKGICKPFAGNARTRAGNLLEPVILEMARQEHKLPLIANADTLVDTILPWLGATPDAFEVVGDCREGVGECKAVGLELAHHWEAGPPDYVLCQVTVQMHVARVNRCRVLALLGTELRFFTVEKDVDLETAILEKCDDFRRKYLETNTPPPPDGSDSATRAIAGLFPRSRAKYIEPSTDLETAARQVLALRAQVGELQRIERKLLQEMQLTIGDAEGFEGSDYKVTWKSRAAYEVSAHIVPEGRVMRVSNKPKKGERAA